MIAFLLNKEAMMDKLHYKGWDIIPTALPTSDNKWTGSCDLARVNGDGLQVFEGATMQFLRDTQEDAIAAACEEAIVQIDNIIANPLVRLA
jgi:hypothetical protein